MDATNTPKQFFPTNLSITKEDVLEWIDWRRRDTSTPPFTSLRPIDSTKLTDELMQQFVNKWFGVIDGADKSWYTSEAMVERQEVTLYQLAVQLQVAA